ncbi:MAG: chemotaxis protein CheW [Clostridium sp.]
MKNCKVVIFKINNEEYAADIMQVERILEYIQPTKVPDSHECIKGIIDYQDIVLPVVDVKKRFHLSETDYNEESKIIVLKGQSAYAGICVDMVVEVLDIEAEKLEDAPVITKREANKYIKSVLKKDNRIIVLLDTDVLLNIDNIGLYNNNL